MPPKKWFRISVFLLVFMIFTVIGYSTPAIFSKRSPDRNPPATAHHQSNIIMIHVDNLESDNPTLISIWAVITSSVDGTPILLKSIAPSPYADQQPASLVSNFSLTPRGKVSPQFIKELNNLDFPWQTYIILDDHAITALSQSLNVNDQTSPRTQTNITSSTSTQQYLHEEHKLAFDICSQVSPAASSKELQNKLRSLSPQHILTDISYRSLAFQLGKFLSQNQTLNCEIIAAAP